MLRLLQTDLRRFAQTAAIAVSDTHTDTLTLRPSKLCTAIVPENSVGRSAMPISDLISSQMQVSLQGMKGSGLGPPGSRSDPSAQTARLCHQRSPASSVHIAFTPLTCQGPTKPRFLKTKLFTGLQQRSNLLQQHFSYQGTDLRRRFGTPVAYDLTRTDDGQLAEEREEHVHMPRASE